MRCQSFQLYFRKPMKKSRPSLASKRRGVRLALGKMSSNIRCVAYGLNQGPLRSFSLIQFGSNWSHCKKVCFLANSEMIIVRAGPTVAAYYGYYILSSSSS
jgi:hypothetical protein